MEINSYLLACILFHLMVLSQTSCTVNVALRRRPPPPPPATNRIVHPFLPPHPLPRHPPPPPPPPPPPKRPLPSKVNDGHHPSLPPPLKTSTPPHAFGSPRYPPPPQRNY
ncbi:hypothetical protein OIU76_024027 [Salix suchowensis]|nr:hypothetical protein OIU76_024027 [Salix suchowensis]